MASVEFDEQGSQFRPKAVFSQSQPTGLVGWLIKTGIIKDSSQGKRFLLGVVLFNIIVTIAIIYYFIL
ncbi:MAG TPA: hypothetical protein VJI66_03255 [Candidatus Paceibacterota bacterium]